MAGARFVTRPSSSATANITSRLLPGNGQAAIDLTLCGTVERIKFHEDHFLELQVMIQESQKYGAAKPPVTSEMWDQRIDRMSCCLLGKQSRHPARGEDGGEGETQGRARAFGREHALL